jgi:5,5'-dehydrodivanillate O-demethylase
MSLCRLGRALSREDSCAGFGIRFYRAEALLAGQAKPIEIMGERFTLYRGEDGNPYVTEFRCPHRGTQLSAGWVEGDSIRCMYHGWLFNSAGQCLEQPAEAKSFAAKIRIKSFPTREYLGLIFSYFGEGEAPSFPRFSHMEGDGVLEVLSTEVWPCNFFQRLDNNGDTYHVPFVHRGAYSASTVNNRSGLPEISKVESPWEPPAMRPLEKAGAMFSSSSCPIFTRFVTPPRSRSASGKIACSGMCL